MGFIEPVNQRFFGSFYYANHYCAWQVLNIGFGLVLLRHYFREANRNHRGGVFSKDDPRLLIFALLFLIALSIPVSQSRSGILMLLLWFFFITIYFRNFFGGKRECEPIRSSKLLQVRWPMGFKSRRRLNDKHSTIKGWRWYRAITLGLLPVIGIVLIACFLALSSREYWGPRMQETSKELSRGLSGEHWQDGLGHRYLHFRDTWRVYEARPVWGWGLDSYRYVLPKFAGSDWGDRLGSSRSGLDAAHTDWLQFLAEFGILEFLLFFIPLFIVVLINLWVLLPKWLIESIPFREARSEKFRRSKRTALLTLGVLLVMFTALFEFPLRNPAVVVATTLTLIVADQISRSIKVSSKRGHE